jgi:hypothetical protein
MDVNEAVSLAKKRVAELFAMEGISNIGLEEVEFNEYDNAWSITIGFSRTWDVQPYNPLNPLNAISGQSRPTRTYKDVRISDADGKVISIKNHEVKS